MAPRPLGAGSALDLQLAPAPRMSQGNGLRGKPTARSDDSPPAEAAGPVAVPLPPLPAKPQGSSCSSPAFTASPESSHLGSMFHLSPETQLPAGLPVEHALGSSVGPGASLPWPLAAAAYALEATGDVESASEAGDDLSTFLEGCAACQFKPHIYAQTSPDPTSATPPACGPNQARPLHPASLPMAQVPKNMWGSDISQCCDVSPKLLHCQSAPLSLPTFVEKGCENILSY